MLTQHPWPRQTPSLCWTDCFDADPQSCCSTLLFPHTCQYTSNLGQHSTQVRACTQCVIRHGLSITCELGIKCGPRSNQGNRALHMQQKPYLGIQQFPNSCVLQYTPRHCRGRGEIINKKSWLQKGNAWHQCAMLQRFPALHECQLVSSNLSFHWS